MQHEIQIPSLFDIASQILSLHNQVPECDIHNNYDNKYYVKFEFLTSLPVGILGATMNRVVQAVVHFTGLKHEM